MPRTFEDSTESQRKSRFDGDGRRSETPEPPEDIEGIDFPSILIPPEMDERGGRSRRRREDIRDRRGNLSEELLRNIDKSLEDFEQEINVDVNNDLEGLSELELLTTIADRLGKANVSTMLMVEQLTGVASILNDVANAVEPSAGITISGINEIEKPDNPETVIPNGDDTSVPTKTLYLRAEPSNDRPVYLGDDSVRPKRGFVLRPGEARDVDIDFRDSMLYMASSKKGQAVQILGVF